MSRHVALLRGVNVGGRNRLPMKELTAIFESVGCSEVSTYIQSGNVVFSASSALAKQVPERVAERLREGFGLETPVVARTAAQWRRVAAEHPLGGEADAKTLHVLFLAGKPKAAQVAALDSERSPPDRFLVMGDNRDNSFDSRGFGFVPLESIYGRATRVLSSLEPAGLLPGSPRWSRFFEPLE